MEDKIHPADEPVKTLIAEAARQAQLTAEQTETEVATPLDSPHLSAAQIESVTTTIPISEPEAVSPPPERQVQQPAQQPQQQAEDESNDLMQFSSDDDSNDNGDQEQKIDTEAVPYLEVVTAASRPTAEQIETQVATSRIFAEAPHSQHRSASLPIAQQPQPRMSPSVSAAPPPSRSPSPLHSPSLTPSELDLPSSYDQERQIHGTATTGPPLEGIGALAQSNAVEMAYSKPRHRPRPQNKSRPIPYGPSQESTKEQPKQQRPRQIPVQQSEPVIQPSNLQVQEQKQEQEETKSQPAKRRQLRKRGPTVIVPATKQALEDEWARLFCENYDMKDQIASQEARISSQTLKIGHLSSEAKHVNQTIGSLVPRLLEQKREIAGLKTLLEASRAQTEEQENRTILAGHARAAAEREAARLSSISKELRKGIEAERIQTARSQKRVKRLQSELEVLVEVQVRNSVLEAENEHLRSDIAVGMEHMLMLVQGEQEVSIELNAWDAAIAMEGAMANKKAKKDLLDPGGDLGNLGLRFRGDSIWETGEVGTVVSSAAGPGNNEVSWGTQTLSLPLSGEVAETATQTEAPPAPARVDLATVGTQTEALPAPALVDLATVGTQTEDPLSPVKTPLLMLSPPLPAPSTAIMATKCGAEFGTQTELEVSLVEAEAPVFYKPIPILPLLLLLLSAFLFALLADRLAAEREVWAEANDTARELVTAWSGEWWSCNIGEWFHWEAERWTGVDRRLLG